MRINAAPALSLFLAALKVLPANNDIGFLKQSAQQTGFLRRGRRPPPVMRQECEAGVSWSHRGSYTEDNPGGWLLVHVGNIMVREASETQLTAAAAATATAGGGGGGGGSAAAPNVGRHGRHVAVSFGGDNPHWMRNLEVDFAAIAPLRLSWDIERVLMIGNRKGHSRNKDDLPEPQQRQEQQLNDRGTGAPPLSVAREEGLSPLSCLPDGVMSLVLEFSQPTLVRTEQVGGVAPDGVGDVAEDGHGGPLTAAHWKVF